MTNAQLERYGLPARPSARKKSEYALWLKLVQHAKHRVCVTQRTHKSAPTITSTGQSDGNTAYSGNYAGYVATGSGVGYVTGTWEVPCEQQSYHVTATLNDMVSAASSQSSPTLLSVGTQEVHTETNGVGSDVDRYFVYFQGQGTSFAGPTGVFHCGDDVSAQIMYDNSAQPAQWRS